MEATSTQEPDGSGRPLLRVAAIVGGVLVAAVVLFLLAQSVASLVAGGDSWDVEPGHPVVVTIDPGTSASGIYASLHAAGVVRSSELDAAAKAAGVEDRLQAGSYSFTTDMDAESVVRRLVEGGDVATGNSFTVIEGWTIDRIIDELSETTEFSKAEYQKVLRDGTVTSPLLPQDTDDPILRWEGLLYPAKYLIAQGATPILILQMMSDEMTRRFEHVDWSGIGALGVSRYEALVIGSLIEWESGTDEDRPVISSVIHNRLDQPMRLQIRVEGDRAD